MSDAFRLVHLIRDVAQQEVAPLERSTGVGVVATVEGNKASLTIGANEQPTPGFTVPPHLDLAPGDLVEYFRLGAYMRVGTVLNRNALAVGKQAALFADVRDYGAVGDGITDDTVAIQDALNALTGGGILFLPAGTYKVTSTLTIPRSSVALVGAGGAHDPAAVVHVGFDPATKILWAGGAAAVFSAAFVQGIRIEDIGIDGGATATRGLYLDRVQNSTFRRIGIRRLEPTAGVALYLTTTNTGSGTHWNLFEQISARCPTFLYASGTFESPKETDTTLNTFNRCMSLYGSTTNANGIVLDIADNNQFFGMYMFREYGAGYGVEFGARARGNQFLDLEPHSGGVIARTPSVTGWSNEILSYKRGNGAPAPVLETGAKLTYTEDSAGSTGWHIQGFGEKFGVGHIAPVLAGGGANGIDVLSTTSGSPPEVRVRASAAATGTAAVLDMAGRDVNGVEVRAQFLAGGAITAALGSVSAHALALKTGNVERARIDTDGRLGVGLTPVVGKGILQLKEGIGFPAAQVASTDANTLDDYEEGSFTPRIVFAGSDAGAVYGNQVGLYVKVGRLVLAYGYVTTTTKSTATGGMSITGLPFAADSTTNAFGSTAFGFWTGLTGNAGPPVGLIGASAAAITMRVSTAANASTNLTEANATATTGFAFATVYRTS